MAARYKKSRKRSGGKKRKPPKNFQIFLDENLQKCAPILSVLQTNGIVTHQYSRYFPNPGLADEAWLPVVGNNNWILLTTDTHFRFNALERLAIIRYRVKVFEFSDNTQGGPAMADALQNGLQRIINLSRSLRAPFICTISPNGHSRLRWKPRRSELRLATRIQWQEEK